MSGNNSIGPLQVLSEITGKAVTDVMAPHKDVLQDMIPPKKHLLRHQPVNAQIGLMDGNTFCTTLSPRLFTIDLSVMEHKGSILQKKTFRPKTFRINFHSQFLEKKIRPKSTDIMYPIIMDNNLGF
jgi:hypothetical protein